MTTIDLGKWGNAQATLQIIDYLRSPDMAMDVAEVCAGNGLDISEDQAQIVLQAAAKLIGYVAGRTT